MCGRKSYRRYRDEFYALKQLVVADIVRSHHEKYDGKGYPDGLKGTDIPLGARIIAIAEKVIEHWDEVLKSREDETNNCI